jgi:hypothetical protein
MRRAGLALCLALWAGVACGPPPPVNTGGKAPAQGEPCATDGQACQPGLACDAQQRCDWISCRDAPSPLSWCAGRLGVPEERAACDADGVCATLRSGLGEPCAADEGCHFGLVCEQGACVNLCTSSASCPGEDRACVERSPGSPDHICGPRPACDTLLDPAAFCADLLGVAADRVVCRADGVCELPLVGARGACARDRECQAGLVCENGRCEASCAEVCADAALTCIPRPTGGDGSVCRHIPSGCAIAQDPEFYCLLARGDGSQCDEYTGECSEPPPPPPPPPRRYYAIQIKDVSARPSCEARTPEGLWEPGADLVSVEVHREDGTLHRLVGPPSWTPGTGVDNDFIEPDLYAASQRAVEQVGPNEPVCPLLRQADGRLELGGMLSLGCGGVAKLTFYVPEQAMFTQPMFVESGMRIRVGEYAPVCDGLSALDDPDAYMVTLCEVDEFNVYLDCTEPLTAEPVRGTVWLDVP